MFVRTKAKGAMQKLCTLFDRAEVLPREVRD